MLDVLVPINIKIKIFTYKCLQLGDDWIYGYGYIRILLFFIVIFNKI